MTKQPQVKNDKGQKKFVNLARNKKDNSVQRIWGRKVTDKETGEKVWKFKRSKNNPNPDASPRWKSRLTEKNAKKAQKFGEDKGWAVWRTADKYPFLCIYNSLGDPEFGKRLNNTGKDIQRYLKTGWERDQAQQHDLYYGYRMGYKNYNLAACCDQTCSIHEKKKCGQGPCKSNHCGQKGAGTGTAADVSVFHSGRDGSSTSIRAWKGGSKTMSGSSAMSKNKLKALVSSEDWHCSISGY